LGRLDSLHIDDSINELSKLANKSISRSVLLLECILLDLRYALTIKADTSASAISTFDNSLLQESASRLHCLEQLHHDEREGLTGRQSVTNETGSRNCSQHYLDAAHWLV
jgi:hypothetical protein